MKKLGRGFIAVSIVASLLVVSGCTQEQDASTQQKSQAASTVQDTTSTTNTQDSSSKSAPVTSKEVPAALAKPLKIALVTRIASGSFYAQYSAGVKQQVTALGGEVKIYDSNNDLAKMASNVETAVNEKVDAILINNGRAEALKPSVEKAIAAGIPVVAYDSDLTIPGVTSIDQDDYLLAWQSLKKLADDLNGKGKIAVLWVAGYNPMERRQVMIDAFYKRYSNIKEVARFGSVSANTALDMQSQVEALLKKYPNKGDIDAIYTTWDEFTRGALQALQQAGRTDIKVYGVDLTDEDLQLMLKQDSPWIAASATNPSDVGQVQTRLVYQKVAGEKVPDSVQIEPHLVKREVLPDQVKFDELSKYVNGWGSSDLATSGWMDTLAKGVKK